MFYISKITPLFYLLAIFDFLVSIFFKINNDYINLIYFGIFGFILNVMVGTFYQIFPNAQSQKLKMEFLSFLIFVLFLFSSILYFKSDKLASLILLFSTFLFSLHIITIIKMIKPLTIRFLFLSLIYTNLAVLFLFLSKFYNFPIQLAVHTLTIGAMLNAVYGVQSIWIPMLTMKILNLNLSNRLFYIKQISTSLVLLSFYFLNYKLIAFSGLLEMFSLILFLYIIYDALFKNGKILQLPISVYYFLSGLILLLIGLFIALFMAFLNKIPDLIYIHINFVYFGFAFITISGAILHLLPRVVWNWKMNDLINQNIKNFSGLINENFAKYGLYIYIFSVFIVSILDLFNFNVGSIFYIISFLILGINIFRIYRFLYFS